MLEFKLRKELEFSKKIAFQASEEILKIYQTNFKVEYKDDKTPLTEADKRSNEIIVNNLLKEFPDYAILSEEFEDDKSRLNNKWCWIIDPLDGTKEFLKKNNEFTINIALSYEHKVILGVVFIPVTKEIYYATVKNGAFYEKNGFVKRIEVSNRTKDLVLVKSRSHSSEKLNKLIESNKNLITKIITSGSSIKGCMVARGNADIYYRFGPTMEWDTAAVHCIIEEAGGIFKQLDDSEMLYNRENSINEKGFYIINNIKNKLQF